MPGHAAASGSAVGGFIEGVTGGFERTTEFRRKRRMEQQIAEQIQARLARQGRQDERQAERDEWAAEDRERAAVDRERAEKRRALDLWFEHGITRIPSGASDADPTGIARAPVAGMPTAGLSETQQAKLDELRGGVGRSLRETADEEGLPPGLPRQVRPRGAQPQPGQGFDSTATQVPGADPRAVGAHLAGPDEPQVVDPTDAFLGSLGYQRLGLSAADREAEERSGFLGKVAEFMALSPEEREAAMQDPAMRQALDELGLFDDVLSPRNRASFGVTGGGLRTFSGGTREQADEFARRNPRTPTEPRDGPRMSLDKAIDLVTKEYTEFDDRGRETLTITSKQLIEFASELSRTGKFPAEPREAPFRSLSGIGNFAAPESQFRGVGPLRSFANAPVPVIPRASTPNEVPSDDILKNLVQRFGEDEEAIVAELKRLGYRTD